MTPGGSYLCVRGLRTSQQRNFVCERRKGSLWARCVSFLSPFLRTLFYFVFALELGRG